MSKDWKRFMVFTKYLPDVEAPAVYYSKPTSYALAI